ncbi:recombinase family protein [Nocardioides sp. CFH 31398]|uniref:recombinase family protein n=1 Tax=Nocardioides sp. CFH 31398 TaxID=2919579 RepID=UPI001F0540C3|nr:recombinase family protein [Nocardioides sp. CFH 31398]MCH1867054.1 recombinase family protein [Nocardioides sp. CFH 31398]
METTAKRAAIYTRISSDPEGKRAGVRRQREDCERFAAEHGFEIAEHHFYEDNDKSASTKSKKPRPRYSAMLRGARDQEFDAIIVWSSSRLTRRPRELEDVIDLSLATGIAIYSCKTGDYNLNNARGRSRARDDARRDAEEAEETGERVARAAEQRAKAGEWHGGHLPHGYRVEGGRLVVDPTTAPLMQEAAQRLLTGESLYAVANDFNERGLLTSRGSHWRSQTIRKAMLSPSIVGKREHGGVLYDGQWEPLISETAWTKLRELLTDTSRKFGAADGSYSGKRPLGGGLTVCADCGKPLVSARYRDAIRLVCHKQATGGCGGVTITYDQYEHWLVELVMARIDGVRWRAENARTAAKVDTRADRLRTDRKMLQEERRRVVRSFEVGVRSESEMVRRVGEIDAEVRSIDGQLSALVTDAVLDEVATADDARRLWREADTTKRRRFLAAMIETVHVHKWPEGMPTKLTRRTSERMAARRGEKIETEAQFAKRRDQHAREALRQRVCIRWRR